MIAIIAILASMLLPALGKARDKAVATQCISKQKQLGLSIGFYRNDNNDFFVAGNHDTEYLQDAASGLKTYGWAYLLAVTGCIQDVPGDKGKYVTCPTTYRIRTPGQLNYGHSYGASYMNVSTANINQTYAFDLKHQKLQRFGHARVILLADSGIPSQYATGGNTPGLPRGRMLLDGDVNNYSHVYPVHAGKANLLMLDGHVESRGALEIYGKLGTFAYNSSKGLNVYAISHFTIGVQGSAGCVAYTALPIMTGN